MTSANGLWPTIYSIDTAIEFEYYYKPLIGSTSGGDARNRKTIIGGGAALLLFTSSIIGAFASDNDVIEKQIDFNEAGYSIGQGSPAGQNGWVGNGTYDWGLVDTTNYPSSGLESGNVVFRHSNAINGNTGAIQQLYTPMLDEAVGEVSTGAKYNTFSAGFTVASTTGSVQPGLNLEVAVSNPTGNRAGADVGLRHVDEGLEISLRWPEYGGEAEMSDWRTRYVVVDASVPHKIDISVFFRDNAPDLVEVYIDGELSLEGQTWEGYHDAVKEDNKQTVNGLLFRMSSSAPTEDGIGYQTGVSPTDEQAEALQDEGLLYSDISYSETNTAPTYIPELLPEPVAEPDVVLSDLSATTGTVPFSITGFVPGEQVYAAWYSDPVFENWYQADENGTIAGNAQIPEDLGAGSHTLQFIGQKSGKVAAGVVKIDLRPDRLQGKDRYETSLRVAEESFAEGAPVILTTGEQFPDSIVGSALSQSTGGVIVLTRTKSISSELIEFLSNSGTSQVYVLGGTSAISQSVYTQIESAVGINRVERIEGADRYETGRAVAEKIIGLNDGSVGTLYVATGKDYPDSLMAAVAAGIGNSGVLLVPGDGKSLDQDTVNWLEKNEISDVKVVGGPKAVSDSIYSVLKTKVSTIDRIQGEDRYQTAQAINDALVNQDRVNRVWVTSGNSYADSIVATAIVNIEDERVALSRPDCLPGAVLKDVNSKYTNLERLTLVGGAVALSDNVLSLHTCS